MASEKISKMEARLAKMQAQLQKAKALESAKERKATNKRRYLLGAMLEDWMGADEELKSKVQARLDGFLTRDLDRRIFGLSPIEKKKSDA